VHATYTMYSVPINQSCRLNGNSMHCCTCMHAWFKHVQLHACMLKYAALHAGIYIVIVRTPNFCQSHTQISFRDFILQDKPLVIVSNLKLYSVL